MKKYIIAIFLVLLVGSVCLYNTYTDEVVVNGTDIDDSRTHTIRHGRSIMLDSSTRLIYSGNPYYRKGFTVVVNETYSYNMFVRVSQPFYVEGEDTFFKINILSHNNNRIGVIPTITIEVEEK